MARWHKLALLASVAIQPVVSACNTCHDAEPTPLNPQPEPPCNPQPEPPFGPDPGTPLDAGSKAPANGRSNSEDRGRIAPDADVDASSADNSSPVDAADEATSNAGDDAERAPITQSPGR